MATARTTSVQQLATAPMLTLLQRLNLVQQEVDYIQKDKKPGMKYSIVSHDAVTAKVRPLMVKHGVLYYPWAVEMEQSGNRTQMHMVVRFVSIDDAADFIDVHSAGYGIDEQDKGPGKAMSYAVKYALLKVLGLESGDDPDEDQNVQHVDRTHPDWIAIEQFIADVDTAKTVDELKKIRATHIEKLRTAAATFPARYESAGQAYAARLHAIEKMAKEPAA